MTHIFRLKSRCQTSPNADEASDVFELRKVAQLLYIYLKSCGISLESETKANSLHLNLNNVCFMINKHDLRVNYHNDIAACNMIEIAI